MNPCTVRNAAPIMWSVMAIFEGRIGPVSRISVPSSASLRVIRAGMNWNMQFFHKLDQQAVLVTGKRPGGRKARDLPIVVWTPRQRPERVDSISSC